MAFQKNPPKELYNRDYKKLDQSVFKEKLCNWIMRFTIMRPLKKYSSLPWINMHLQEKKALKANKTLYMTETLRKAIMRRL